MIRHVEDVANRYVEELRKQHAGLVIELFDGESPWIDANLRVMCTSGEQVLQVIETVARLTSNFYMDDGVYIEASASFTGPMPERAK